MKRKTVMRITALYACILLLILSISVALLLRKRNRATLPASIQTEYIYVYVSEEATTTQFASEENTETIGWIVKEYRGKIGIFNKSGSLIQELDTYVKTLPTTDRRLLGEGIYIHTKAELNALIEDYTE